MRNHAIDWALDKGQSLFADDDCQSHTITCIKNIQNWDINKINEDLLQRGFRMDRGYGKFKGKAFRIPHMGNVYMNDLQEYLSVFNEVLS